MTREQWRTYPGTRTGWGHVRRAWLGELAWAVKRVGDALQRAMTR